MVLHVLGGACLLIVPAVQVPQLSDQARMDQAIGSDEVVRHGRLAMVHVRQDAYIPDALLREWWPVTFIQSFSTGQGVGVDFVRH